MIAHSVTGRLYAETKGQQRVSHPGTLGRKFGVTNDQVQRANTIPQALAAAKMSAAAA